MTFNITIAKLKIYFAIQKINIVSAKLETIQIKAKSLKSCVCQIF